MDTLLELAKQVNAKIERGEKLGSATHLIQNYHGQDWQPLCQFSSEEYQRIPIMQTDRIEMRLLCWGPKQCALPHDHPEDGCILKVLSGELQEVLYQPESLQIKETRQLEFNQISIIAGEAGIHSILNTSNLPATSLHIYAPPGYKPNYFEGPSLSWNVNVSS